MFDTCTPVMQQEKKLPSGSANRWREKYCKRFVERQIKVRNLHFNVNSNKILSAQSNFNDEIDIFLANSETFRKLKPRLMVTPKTDDRHALIYFMAADWCRGSLDYLMRENEDDGSEEVYSTEENFYVDETLKSYGKLREEVKFVIYSDEKITLDDFETRINHLGKFKCQDDARNAIENSLYKTIIAGDEWWLEYDCICCNGPCWYYHEHPNKKWL